MDKLSEICTNFENNLLILNELAENLSFSEICEFSLSEFVASTVSETNKFNELKKVNGIYLFEIKKDISNYNSWIELFEKKFRGREDDEKYFLHKFTPNVIEIRKNYHSEKNPEWVPLYLGKSKNIKDRIHKHIFSELGTPPFGLKLYKRLNLENELVFLNDSFRLKVIKFENMNSDIYNVVIPYLEKRLREKLKPIVGRQ